MTRKDLEQKYHDLQEAKEANDENVIGIGKRLVEVEKFIKNRKARDEDTINLRNELQEVERTINGTNAQVESKLVIYWWYWTCKFVLITNTAGFTTWLNPKINIRKIKDKYIFKLKFFFLSFKCSD